MLRGTGGLEVGSVLLADAQAPRDPERGRGDSAEVVDMSDSFSLGPLVVYTKAMVWFTCWRSLTARC
jgi:hypothetical protein